MEDYSPLIRNDGHMFKIFSAGISCIVFCLVALPLWAAENAWHKIALDAIHIVALVSDPVRPATLYAVTSRGLMRSMDSGLHWDELGENLPKDALPSSMAVSQFNSKELYAGYDGGGVFKSVDGGNIWQAVNQGLPNPYVRSIVISPKDPNLVYIGIQGGVGISTNGGKYWHMASGFRRSVNVNSVVIDPKNPQYLYAATGGAGVFKSGNGGVSWKDINDGLSSKSIFALHVDPENPDLLLAGANHPASPTDLYVGESSGGVFRSLDGGRTWQESGLLNTTVFSFSSTPEYPGVIYAGAWGGAYRSVDKGLSWVDINTGLDNAFLHTTYVSPTKPPLILAGTTFGLLSYTDADMNTILSGRHAATAPVAYYAGACALLALMAGYFFVMWKRKRSKQLNKQPVW
jgi:photosystem II stability/assembly factor-like uncharacterized protein